MTDQNVVGRSTATEKLRHMLDERGVEWWQSANTLGCVFTRWYSPLFGDGVCAMENGKEGLVLFDHYVTPEQAIAATLGRGTWSDFDMQMAYHMGYEDALARRKPDAGKVVTNG